MSIIVSLATIALLIVVGILTGIIKLLRKKKGRIFLLLFIPVIFFAPWGYIIIVAANNLLKG